MEAPKHHEDGEYTQEYERFARIEKWADFTGLAIKTLRKKLKGVMGIDGKDRSKRIHLGGYYPESIIRERCANLLSEDLKKLPMANKEGFLALGGYKYGHCWAWAKALKMAHDATADLTKNCRSIRGMDCNNHPRLFFLEEDIQAAYEEFCNRKVRDDGIIKIQGKICITVTKWADANEGVGLSKLQKAIQDGQLPIIGYAMSENHTLPAYELSAVLQLEYIKELRRE